MISDTNKGITAISYNHLNLPTQVTINGENILYIYDAAGIKLQKVANGITTEYAASYIYENGSLKFANHAEGYIEPDGEGGYDYVYQYKDHLGNVRLAYSDSNNDGSIETSEIMNEKNYYPFGLLHKGYNSQVNGTENNHQTYLGQEFQKELNLNWHSYKWRNADPALGRFFGIDPIAEDYPNQTVYQFASNNPVWKIEIEGLEGYTPNGEDLMNGLGYGVSDADGGGKTGTTEVKEGFLSKAFNAIGSFLGTIHNDLSSAVSGGVSSVMGIANVRSGGSTTEALASGDENAVYQSLNNEAAGLYNAVPEIAGEVAATMVEIAAAEMSMGSKTPNAKVTGITVTEKTISKALSNSTMKTTQAKVSLPMVKRYVDKIQSGQSAPPIKVAQGNVIIDGNHRYVAGEVAGKPPKQTAGTLSKSQENKVQPIQNTKVDPKDWGGN